MKKMLLFSAVVDQKFIKPEQGHDEVPEKKQKSCPLSLASSSRYGRPQGRQHAHQPDGLRRQTGSPESRRSASIEFIQKRQTPNKGSCRFFVPIKTCIPAAASIKPTAPMAGSWGEAKKQLDWPHKKNYALIYV
ncbi:hypothetical protein [uncultured Cohaesibacter sp.]|uniref:hypothetical protein n=1 Tax=uncultured Cohaesibacter sp. TaxID=1002546 RepID=UPI0029C82759|nr:hypothetical protein [uncultured Cohaesibacter sp.]